MVVVDVVALIKTGGSFYLRVPAELLERLNLKEGDKFLVQTDNKKIVYAPQEATSS